MTNTLEEPSNQRIAACLRGDCDWTHRGSAEDVEREARRHSGEIGKGIGHPTVTGLASAPGQATS